jgi:TonB-dependent SusC/RagA subfamily outer membrane receptor
MRMSCLYQSGWTLSLRRWYKLWVVLLVFGWIPPVSAQGIYNVFPAVPPNSPATPAQPTDQVRQVTLDARDSSVAYIVSALVHQSHLKLYFDDTDPSFARRITAHVDKVNVMDALATVLRGTGLEAKLLSDGETVVVRKRTGTASADQGRARWGTIVGHVTDSTSGAGLGGATVRVAGTKLSTISSDSGHFTLKDVPIGDQVLSIKLFGYRPVERTVTVVDSASATVKIVMVPVPTVLSGVVTTATGLVRKVEVGNDITTLNVDSIRQVAPITSVTDLLETRVPGLTVLHTDGVPGDPSRLRLRGAGSVQLNNDPIVIIDGIRVYSSQSDPRNENLTPKVAFNGSVAAPSPLDQIDPASIETIEVFKGPSATAIYGSDAAAGVIVITTKHGHAGPTHWDLALGNGVNWLPGSWPVNYFKFGYVSDGLLGSNVFCAWNEPNCTLDSLVAFQALNEPQYSVFAHGSQQQATLTVSGWRADLAIQRLGERVRRPRLLETPRDRTAALRLGLWPDPGRFGAAGPLHHLGGERPTHRAAECAPAGDTPEQSVHGGPATILVGKRDHTARG